MKKILSLIIFVSISLILVKAQSPKAFKYQAIARDQEGNVISNTDLSLRIRILEGLITETNVYTEIHDVRSNAYGLINLTIGEGTVESGNMETIDWGNSSYLLQVEIADVGATDYQILGKAQLVSVPYALYADKAGNAFSGDYNDLVNTPDLGDTTNYLKIETDPIFNISVAKAINESDTSLWNNKSDFSGDYNDLVNTPDLSDTANYLKVETDPVYSVSVASGITAADTSSWNNKLETEVDGSVINELQELIIENDSLKISDGNGISLNSICNSPWGVNGDSIYYTTGNVGIGLSNPSSLLEINGEGSSIYSFRVIRPTTNNESSYGIFSFTDVPTSDAHKNIAINGAATSGVGYAFGVRGQANTSVPSDAGRAYGVVGEASNATSGYNCAVYGFLRGSNDGSAVLGRVGELSNDKVFNGMWAGYFVGKVHVQDTLGVGTTSPQRNLHVNDVMRLEPRASVPSNPSEGDIYMDATTHKLMVYDGTTWQACW